jgi:hypothetical protein
MRSLFQVEQVSHVTLFDCRKVNEDMFVLTNTSSAFILCVLTVYEQERG